MNTEKENTQHEQQKESGRQRRQTLLRVAQIVVANVCRTVLALTFIFSGFVKAVDPHGTQYKVEDYLYAAGLTAHIPEWLSLSVAGLLFTVEFCIGMMLLLAAKRHLAAWLALLFMLLMTVVAVWLYVANPVADCGCFGDAIHLSNAQTLAKNIVLLVCAIGVFCLHDRMQRFISDGNSSIVFNYSILFIIGTALYSLYFLPPFDFRPYHIGVNIAEAMQPTTSAAAPLYETTFLMEKEGVVREFDLDHYPDTSWTFVDSKTTILRQGTMPQIHDFTIVAPNGADITDSLLAQQGYTFLLVAPSLDHADSSNFGTIDLLHEYALTYGYPFYCLTASTARAIAHWQDITGADYPFFFCDALTLKTMIRSNPGLILLHNGTIIQKWSNGNLPKEERLNAPLDALPIGQQKEIGTIKKIAFLLLIFILPILLFSAADRLWAVRQRLRRRRRGE